MCAALAQHKDTRQGACTNWALVGACAAAFAVALLSPRLRQQDVAVEEKQEVPRREYYYYHYGSGTCPADADADGDADAEEQKSGQQLLTFVLGALAVLSAQALSQLLRRWTGLTDSADASPAVEHLQSLAGDLGGLLESGRCADVIFCTGDMRLKAHRAVLVARSPAFASMLADNGLKDDGNHVVNTDTEPEILLHLLVFLYTSKVRLHATIAIKLLVAAQQYQVSELVEQCEIFLSRCLSVEIAAACAVLCVQYACPHLRGPTMRFIAAHFKQVVATQGWADAVHQHPDAVVKVGHWVAAANK